ncbi:hypothetical protein GRI44_05325 [Altererythrobacter confluentis]|uniref:Uncharacterized protein n=1 Tax=Allopontixanthobacter confluentis TaxID=1849021 RepID=A0A6L7GDZ9_9SPHN|nr:hypothetical protein [Allopontixanthobacter confluentis]MXP14169.1 hypothetical protein [Allopontixanthobacter confluentis]
MELMNFLPNAEPLEAGLLYPRRFGCAAALDASHAHEAVAGLRGGFAFSLKSFMGTVQLKGSYYA